MATSSFLKKLRNRVTKKKTFDIETPCSAGHGTVLMRRYDDVPIAYGDCCADRQNILRDFVPDVQKHEPSSGRLHGELTLPRRRLRSGHHRTQSTITVVADDDIDLYNAIGDHRRSSYSCMATMPHKIASPVISISPKGTQRLTSRSVRCPVEPVGRSRNAAKDPLPAIVKDNCKKGQKTKARMKDEGKFDVPPDESPRYTGIDDYSTLDFDPTIFMISPQTFRENRKKGMGEQPEPDRKCMTIPSLSSSMKIPTPNVATSRCTVLDKPQSSKDPQPNQPSVQQDVVVVDSKLENSSTVALAADCAESSLSSEQKLPVKRGLLDVINGYYDRDKINGSDLPIPHESCMNKTLQQPAQVEQTESAEFERSYSPDCSSSMLSNSPSSRNVGFSHSTDDLRNYPPQNSGHHEYKEAHQVLRATSLRDINSIDDLQVSSSIEELYAHVPKGTGAKTPDTSDRGHYVSDPNTDNEDSLPPPPIPIRNYRNTDSCCSTAAQLGSDACTCSRIKVAETKEDVVDDAVGSEVIHQQPHSLKPPVEPIHMTIEEVWQDACALGIPMEKPSTMTLHRQHRSDSMILDLASSCIDKKTDAEDDPSAAIDSDSADTVAIASQPIAAKKKKFKLKNIFKKTGHSSPSKPPTPSHRRTLTPAETSALEDVHNYNDAIEMPSEPFVKAGTSTSVDEPTVQSAGNLFNSVDGLQTSGLAVTTINADFIDSLRKLKDCGWYWGPLSWDGAEAWLANKVDGSFLVRDSSDDRYILSISFRSQGITHHTRIEHYKGTFSFFSQPKSHGAGTIIEFVEKAMEHSLSGKFLYFLRPRAPGLPPAPVQLLYPLSRFRVMQSLQHICRFMILRTTRYDHIDRLPIPRKLKRYLRESQYYTEYSEDYESEDGGVGGAGAGGAPTQT